MKADNPVFRSGYLKSLWARDIMLLQVFGSLAFMVIQWTNPLLERANILTGHLLVWVAIGSFGLYVGRRADDYWLGAFLALFGGCIYEILWNVSALVYYFNDIPGLSAFLWWFIGTQCALVAMIACCLLVPQFRRAIVWRRFWVCCGVFQGVIVLWILAGFPITVHGGESLLYLNLPANFIEILTWQFWLVTFGHSINWPFLDSLGISEKDLEKLSGVSPHSAGERSPPPLSASAPAQSD